MLSEGKSANIHLLFFFKMVPKEVQKPWLNVISAENVLLSAFRYPTHTDVPTALGRPTSNASRLLWMVPRKGSTPAPAACVPGRLPVPCNLFLPEMRTVPSGAVLFAYPADDGGCCTFCDIRI